MSDWFRDYWIRWTCPHPELTAADEHGYAICVRCGGTVPGLTKYTFDQGMEAIRRSSDRKNS